MAIKILTLLCFCSSFLAMDKSKPLKRVSAFYIEGAITPHHTQGKTVEQFTKEYKAWPTCKSSSHTQTATMMVEERQ
jgi:hypothetical protein